MGYTSYHATYYKKGKIDIKAEIDAMWKSEDSNYELIKSSLVGSIYYGAIKCKATKEIVAVVYKTSTNMKDYFNFSYKSMDESMNPCYYDCPKSILKLLTPTDNEYANEWRKENWANIRRKKDIKILRELPIHSQVKVIIPHDTRFYKKGDEVILTKIKRPYSNRSMFIDLNKNVYINAVDICQYEHKFLNLKVS